MKILIVEDEELAIEKLRKTLRAVDAEAEVVGVVSSIQSSVDWLMSNPAPDVILMDIELSDGQSFEIFNQVQVKSPVIFTTSYDEYAIKAFKVNSIDYLLKPVEEEELKAALEKFNRLQQNYAHRPATNISVNNLVNELKSQLQPPGYRNRFLVKHGQQLISVETKEIAYFFAEGRLCYFLTWDKYKYVVDYTIEQLGEMVDPTQYFRVNRAYLIHIKSIQQIHNYFNGKLKLHLRPTVEKDDVIVSRERATEFKEWMGK
jgi:DNA-binding LytR/AlgR family response regulator